MQRMTLGFFGDQTVFFVREPSQLCSSISEITIQLSWNQGVREVQK
jgi:hypothetical protein